MDALKTGALIAQVRKEKGLTQSGLAEQLHVSTQAVSKWERGLNFPDITLMEPLAQALELTVSELMAGERNAPAEEALVRDSLRLSLAHFGPKVRRWKGLFLCALALLVLIGGALGYLWVRDNTEYFPQRETVIAPMDTQKVDKLVARLAGNNILGVFELTQADDLTGLEVRLELWTGDGLCKEWSLWDRSIPQDHSRQAQFSFALQFEDGVLQCNFLYGTDTFHVFLPCTVDDIPYLSPSQAPDAMEDYMGFAQAVQREEVLLDREAGTVLAGISVDMGEGCVSPPTGNAPHTPRQGDLMLLLRLVPTA